MRRLRKSSMDKVFFGVCGGIGRYLDIDPVLVRVGFVILALAGLSGVLIYLVLAIIMPEDDGLHESDALESSSSSRAREGLAAVLIIGGAVLLLANLGAFSWFRWNIIGPIVLIAIGLAIIAQRYRRPSS